MGIPRPSSDIVVDKILFPAPRPSYNSQSFPAELVFVPGSDGVKVPCLFMPCRSAHYILIYFHANGEDLGTIRPVMRQLSRFLMVHVLAVEYPGYGICPGKTSEAGILANARVVMRFVLE